MKTRCLSVNGSQIGHQDFIGYLNDIKQPHVDDPHLMGGIGAILLPSTERNSLLHIMSSMLQIFKLRGLFSGLENEDAYEHLETSGIYVDHSPLRSSLKSLSGRGYFDSL